MDRTGYAFMTCWNGECRAGLDMHAICYCACTPVNMMTILDVTIGNVFLVCLWFLGEWSVQKFDGQLKLELAAGREWQKRINKRDGFDLEARIKSVRHTWQWNDELLGWMERASGAKKLCVAVCEARWCMVGVLLIVWTACGSLAGLARVFATAPMCCTSCSFPSSCSSSGSSSSSSHRSRCRQRHTRLARLKRSCTSCSSLGTSSSKDCASGLSVGAGTLRGVVLTIVAVRSYEVIIVVQFCLEFFLFMFCAAAVRWPRPALVRSRKLSAWRAVPSWSLQCV